MLTRLHDEIVDADFWVWHYINNVWHNQVLDVIMPFIRNQYTWAPLYLFLLIFVLYNYKLPKAIAWVVGFLLCFALADGISAQIIKPLIHRTRPCNDPRLVDFVRLLVPRSSGYSFPSSHATNHFALGVFMAKTFHRHNKWIWPLPILWAMSVGYAQIYVGVHFPLDVLCGSILGIVIGYLISKLYLRYFGTAYGDRIRTTQ